MVNFSAFASFVAALSVSTVAAASLAQDGHKHPNGLHFTRRATDVVPTAPGPGDVFRTGQQCTIAWTEGTASRWKETTIDLMTGANQAMTKVTNVATNVDGTSLSSYSWTCPDVTPNAPVYFYQFTDKKGANPTWTTRFTIASSSGNTVAAANADQPNGDAIPWGTGALASGSGSSPSSGSSSSGSSSSSNSGSESGSSSSAASGTKSSPSSSQTSSSSVASNQSSSSSSGSDTVSVRAAFVGLVAVAVGAVLA